MVEISTKKTKSKMKQIAFFSFIIFIKSIFSYFLLMQIQKENNDYFEIDKIRINIKNYEKKRYRRK